MIGYIYKFTNPLNNKVYIGQTVNLHRRFTKHRYDTPKCHTKFSNKGKNGNSLEFLQEIRNKASKVNSKPVIQYSVDNCFIREFKSSTEAANILNLNPRLIGKCCRGVIKTSGGFIWKFKTI